MSFIKYSVSELGVEEELPTWILKKQSAKKQDDEMEEAVLEESDEPEVEE